MRRFKATINRTITRTVEYKARDLWDAEEVAKRIMLEQESLGSIEELKTLRVSKGKHE